MICLRLAERDDCGPLSFINPPTGRVSGTVQRLLWAGNVEGLVVGQHLCSCHAEHRVLYKHMNAALEMRPHAAGQGESGIETAVAAPLNSLLPAGPEPGLVHKQVCSILGTHRAGQRKPPWQHRKHGRWHQLMDSCADTPREGTEVDTGLDNGQHSQKSTRQQIQAWLRRSTLQRQTCLCIYMIGAPAPQPMSRQALDDAGFFSQGLACKSK